MKKITFKKSVLCGILGISSILLLVSMFFSLACLSIMPSSGNIAGLTAENAFSMMDFKSVLIALKKLWAGEVVAGIAAYVMLAASVVGIILAVVGLFCFESKTVKTLALWLIIFNTAVAVYYLVSGIIMVTALNNLIRKNSGDLLQEELELLLFKTKSYWALIIQAVLLTGYILCMTLIPEAQKAEKVKQEGKPQMGYAEREQYIVAILQKYKKLYADGVITIMDFEKKKHILMFDNHNIDVDLEERLVEVLTAYRKVYDEEIITYDEYEKKKLQLLAVR